MTDHDPERRAIREAMTRLLEAHPIRSDGKLTVKSLADEAGVKRWILTHRHQDLQAEFRDRVATHGTDTTGEGRSEEHTSELQSHGQLVCRLLHEKKKIKRAIISKEKKEWRTNPITDKKQFIIITNRSNPLMPK